MCISFCLFLSHTLTLTHSNPLPVHTLLLQIRAGPQQSHLLSARHNFTADYSDRVESLGQYLQFKHKNGSIAKNLDKKR